MTPDRDNTPCFIARGKCGHLVACSVDEPDRAKDNAKEVAKWIRQGLAVDKMPVSEVRTAQWCECPRGKR